MTRASANHTWQLSSTLGVYKSNVQPISEAIAQVVTRSPDTGQVNWATTTVLPPVDTVRDYDVFAMGGNLQATAPIFIRLDYMRTTTYPYIKATVGTSTDGAGAIGGTVTPAMQTYSHGAFPNPAQALSTYAAGDGSYFMFCHNLAPANTGTDFWGGVVVERFRDADGTPNGDGYMAWGFASLGASAGQAGGLNHQYSRIFGTGAQTPNEFHPPVMIPGLNGTNTFFSNGTAYAFPFYGWGPVMRGASQALMYGFQADFPRTSEVTLTHYGKPMKFVAFGPAGQNHIPMLNTISGASTKTTLSPLLRWE